MELGGTFPDAYDWWTSVLRGMAPGAGRRSAAGRAAAIIEILPTGYRLTRSRDGLIGEFADIEDLRTGLAQAMKGIRRAERRVAIHLPRGRYLKRSLSPLALPESRLRAMALLDLIASTPLKPEDHVLLPLRPRDRGSSYAIVKNPVLLPVAQLLDRLGIDIAAIGFEAADGPDEEAAGRALSQSLPGGRGVRLGRRISAALMLLLVLALAGTIGHVRYRHSQANQALDVALADAGKEAATVRKLIASRREIMNRLVTIRQEKSGSVPVVVIIEELARILPDNAWLTEVDIRGDTVRIAGFSSAAATLIPLLEQSDYFRAPTFRNPVLRVSGDIGERFTIAMTLERRDG